jgi:hypothetical protein
MTRKDISNVVQAAIRTIPAVLAMLFLSGCPDKTNPDASFNIVCEQNGLCECTSEEQCGKYEICYNGWCVSTRPPALDVIEETGPGLDLVTEFVIQPGAFMSPCESDEDCDSGICLEAAAGVQVCTQECISECPSGWECRGISVVGSSVSFLCFPPLDRLCQACKNDVGCPGADNLCLPIGGELSCGRGCSAIKCPTGYSCQEATSIDGTNGLQCLPENGFCQCTPDNVGKEFSCDVSNDHGTCLGLRTCQDDGSMTECNANIPAPEECDSKDNDCDGFIDEEVDLGECTVENAFGTCTGERICLSGTGEVCNAPIPGTENCDNLDNDCDGFTDEDFKDAEGGFTLLEYCGGCANNCTGKFAHALEVGCDTSGEEAECLLLACEPGFIKAAGNLCLPPIHHLCEPCTDNASCVGDSDKCLFMNPGDTQTFCGRDCSPDNEYVMDCPEGYTCTAVDVDGESFEQCIPTNGSCDCTELSGGLQKPCKTANEFGTCYGVTTCDPTEGWSACQALPAEAEVCDGKDNDCDGIIDEEMNGGECSSTNDFGTCTGIEVCLGLEGPVCTANQPGLETCDSIDNDCDGLIDEEFATNIVTDEDGLLAVVYDFDNNHCGGCGLPCLAIPPATAVQCSNHDGIAVCTTTACQPGYYIYQEQACLPIPSSDICLPCTKDTDCLGPGDSCVTYSEDLQFCGRDCSEGSIYSFGNPGDATWCTGLEGEQGCCPDNFLCSTGQCVRESGDCNCDYNNKLRPCETSNIHGTCNGYEACLVSGPDAGWMPCNAATPEAELCDGIDNDCDGLIDAADDSVDTTGLDGYPGCFNITPACPGKYVCVQMNGLVDWFCSAPKAKTEICNGHDDDCDGEVDEGFVDDDGNMTLLSNCGKCGLDCTVALSHLATDDQGEVLPAAVDCTMVKGQLACVPQECNEGFHLFPLGQTPSVCLALQSANCQPCASSSDCPGIGQTCLSVGSDDGKYCSSRCDSNSPFPGCTGDEGGQDCCPGGFTCEDVPGDEPGHLYCRPVADTCQCHALTAGLQRPCTQSNQEGTVCFGMSECITEGNAIFGWSDCDTTANVEVCDGVDNNCDGTIDDGFLVNGIYANDEHCGECGKNCSVKWSESKQHAIGACDANLPGGPACYIGECVSTTVGGGSPCHVDADCSGDAAGETCLPDFWQCGRLCTGDGECAGGDCLNGTCHPLCQNDSDCVLAHGPWSACVEGHCRTTYDYVNLDEWTGNGCECASTAGLPLDEPDIFETYPLPGQVYADRDCDGLDGDLESALFVRSGTANGIGSIGLPFGTIQEAIDAYQPNLHSQILVTTGAYPERLIMTDGVHLYGGYSPDFFQRDVALFPTVIGGPSPDFTDPAARPGTVYAKDIASPTVLAGFTILGYDIPPGPSGAGKESFGLFIASASSEFIVTNNWFIGGTGGPGLASTNGSAGSDGGNGGNGLYSAECVNGQTCTPPNCNEKNCVGHMHPGGTPGAPGAGCIGTSCGATGCEGMEAEGGENPQVKDNPHAGCVYPQGANTATYAGGPANHCKYDCFVNSNMIGNKGADGTDGTNGSGGGACNQGSGSFLNGEWTAPAGAKGASGTGGIGGMGGSAGANINNNKANSCTIGHPRGDLGATGGGGGAGGNGGEGGNGGGTGGASIAILLADSLNGTYASIGGNFIVRGHGGPGGDGGNGGTGGTGGGGGFGGDAGWPAWCAGVGGAGGRGGDGGNAGGGGGGCGGASFGVAIIGGNADTLANLNAFALPDIVSTGGTGGAGGLSSSAGASGGEGTDGDSSNVKAF